MSDKVLKRLRRPPPGANPPASVNGSRILSPRAWLEIGGSLRLSPRELELVRAVFEDRTDVAIADDLCISRHTVNTHFRRLHEKLGATNRVQIVLRIFRQFVTLVLAPEGRLPAVCRHRAAGHCPDHLLQDVRPPRTDTADLKSNLG